MLKSNVSQVLSGKPSRGINKYMLEEVFFSDSCLSTDEDSGKYAYKEGVYNPQNARFENGKYYFNLPDFWYNHLSNNKSIALRKIDIHAPSLNLSFDAQIIRMEKSSGGYEIRNAHVSIMVPPNQTTESVLSQITRKINKVLSPTSNTQWSTNPFNTIQAVSWYDYDDNRVNLGILRETAAGEDPDKYTFGLILLNFNDNAFEFFNLPIHTGNLPYVEPTQQGDGTMDYTFENVWNREFCFVHASFVNGTSFNYLGRSGEFYPKPSKMYRFGGSSQQFYFELSFDGRTPIKYRLGKFCIDLAFIYHDKDYQAE